jgi:NADPH-dependent ferric siderophore reductase
MLRHPLDWQLVAESASGVEVLASNRRLESPESAERMVARYTIYTLKAATTRLVVDLIFHEVKLLDE